MIGIGKYIIGMSISLNFSSVLCQFTCPSERTKPLEETLVPTNFHSVFLTPPELIRNPGWL